MRNWIRKFRFAIDGIRYAFVDQVSFRVHLPCAAIVLGVALWLDAKPWQWAAISTAISIVLVAEMFNSAMELLVKALHPDQHPLVGRALDISAGAVFIAAVAAIAIGAVTLGPDLYEVVVAG
jgi:diacylglycerol kinase